MSKYEIGIIIPTYNRYYLTSASLLSLSSCYNIKNTKIVLVDDKSEDFRIPRMLQGFQENFEKNPNCTVKIITHKERWGKWNLYKNFKQGLENTKDCEYIFFTPDDVIYNRYLFDVIRKSFQFFSNEIKCITFWEDNRGILWNNLSKNFGKFNEYFDYINCTDGFLVLFPQHFVSKLSWNINSKIAQKVGSTKIWGKISEQLQKYNIIRHIETLAEHLGNLQSAMLGNKERKLERYIYALNLNLWHKPKILRSK